MREKPNAWLRVRMLNGPSVLGFAGSIFAFAMSMVTAQPALTATDGEPTISFDRAYHEILDRSLRLRVQNLNVEANRQMRLQALGQYTPNLTLNASEVRGNQIPFVPGSSFGTARSAGLSAAANLYRFGGDKAGVDASERDLQGSRERLSTERQGTEVDAVQALISVIARSKQTEITKKLLKVQEDSLRVAKERFSKGYLPRQEVDKVEIELENARARVTDAIVIETEARAVLENLLGHDRIDLEWPWKTTLTQRVPLETQDFALEKRPDWRAAQADVQAQFFRQKRARATLFPSLDLTTSFGVLRVEGGSPSESNWSVGLTLSVPLWDRYTNWGNLQLQKLAEQTAQAELESVSRLAPAQIDALKLNLKSARESALVREKTSALSERLYQDGFQRFRLGRSTVNELAIDQSRLLQSQLLEVDGWSTAHLSQMRLCHALGGFVQASGECQESEPVLIQK